MSGFSQLRSEGLISIFIKEETRTKARAIVTEALASGELTPTVAGSLYGKLRWVFCLGRIVVGALHAVKERQYANRVAGGGWPFSPALLESLQLLEDVLLPPPRPAVLRCRKRGRQSLLVWSDAMWEPRAGRPFGFGRIGLVVKVPRPDGKYDTFFAKDEVPDDFLEVLFSLRAQKTFIHP